MTYKRSSGGKGSVGEMCRKALLEYLENPTEDNKVDLAIAYEDVPQAYRKFVLGDMDDRDTAITMLLERKHIEQAHLRELRERYFPTEQEIEDIRRGFKRKGGISTFRYEWKESLRNQGALATLRQAIHHGK